MAVSSAISLEQERQGVRGLGLRRFVARIAKILIAQRMAAARAEIKRGSERLSLKGANE